MSTVPNANKHWRVLQPDAVEKLLEASEMLNAPRDFLKYTVEDPTSMGLEKAHEMMDEVLYNSIEVVSIETEAKSTKEIIHPQGSLDASDLGLMAMAIAKMRDIYDYVSSFGEIQEVVDDAQSVSSILDSIFSRYSLKHLTEECSCEPVCICSSKKMEESKEE